MVEIVFVATNYEICLRFAKQIAESFYISNGSKLHHETFFFLVLFKEGNIFGSKTVFLTGSVNMSFGPGEDFFILISCRSHCDPVLPPLSHPFCTPHLSFGMI